MIRYFYNVEDDLGFWVDDKSVCMFSRGLPKYFERTYEKIHYMNDKDAFVFEGMSIYFSLNKAECNKIENCYVISTSKRIKKTAFCSPVYGEKMINNSSGLKYYSGDVAQMAILGYASKFFKQTHSINLNFESKSFYDGSALEEFSEEVSGDNIGHLALYVSSGIPVKNCICESFFTNFFYNRVLSVTPLQSEELPIVLTVDKAIEDNTDMFSLASSWFVSGEIISTKYLGQKVRLVNNDIVMKNFIFFLNKFSEQKYESVFSYPIGSVESPMSCYWNCVVKS